MTGKQTILVVDDTVASLKLASDILVREGYQVRPADSGALALASVAASPPDLILLDLRMPGMDGLEVCRQLKSKEQSRSIPVIFVSAASEVEDRVQGLRLGAVDFITKPFQPEELLARVRIQLELGRLNAQLRERSAALQGNQALLQQVIDGAYDSFVAMDAEGLIVDWNTQAAATFGWSREEALGQLVSELIVPQRFRQAHQEGLQHFLATGEGPAMNRAIEITALRRDGCEFPAELAIRAISWGERQLFVAFLRDISERKQVEENIHLNLALQRVRNQILQMETKADWGQVVLVFYNELQHLVDFADCSLNLVDPHRDEMHVYVVSPSYEVHERTAPLAPAIKKVLATGRYLYRASRRDPLFGAEMAPETHSILDVPFPGGTLAINSTIEDAFGAREIQVLEQFAQVMSEGYRRLADLKVLALQQEKLRQAQKLDAVGQLATGVAHEINNPLTSVLGYSELLLRKELDPRVRQHLETIRREGERAQGIAARLLQFVRRQHSTTLQPLNLNPLVEEVLALLVQPFGLDHVQLCPVLAPQLPLVLGHPGQLQQLFLALLQNSREAIKRTGKDGQIRVQTSQQDAWVCLAIEDNGPGIPPHLRERIFEPFFTTKEVGSAVGAGMGLSLCFAIAQEHGGRLWLAPCERGTCMMLELPAELAADECQLKEEEQGAS